MTIKTGLYQHYKGPYYHVVEVATHSETEEQLVVYRALYGDKGVWVRPLSMFIETVEHDATIKPRFAYLDPQTQVLALATIDVIEGQEEQFEAAFSQAKSIISDMQGYISHDLQKQIENPSRYVVLVKWQTLEDHTIGFRESAEYLQWKKRLHHFYQTMPTIEHFQTV